MYWLIYAIGILLPEKNQTQNFNNQRCNFLIVSVFIKLN